MTEVRVPLELADQNIVPEQPPDRASNAHLETAALVTVKTETTTVQQRIAGLSIVDAESLKIAIESGSIVARLSKAVESARTAITVPLNEELRNVNGFYKRYSDPLDKLEEQLKTKIRDYRLECDRRQREEERKKQALLEEHRKAELARANTVGITAPVIPLVIPTRDVPKTTFSDTGSATTKRPWTFEITGAADVPRQYLAVDEAKIRQAVRDGVREIPGVRIFQDVSISIR